MVTYLRRTSFENKIFIFQLKVFASRSSTNGTYWPLLWTTHGGRVVPEKGPEACAENCPPGCSLATLSWKLNRGMGVREDGGGKVDTGQDPVWGYGTSPTSSYFSCDPFRPRNNFEFVNWTQLACFQLSHNAKNVAVLLSFCTMLTSSVMDRATTKTLEQPKQGWVLLWILCLCVNVFLEANWGSLGQLVWLASKPPGPVLDSQCRDARSRLFMQALSSKSHFWPNNSPWP